MISVSWIKMIWNFGLCPLRPTSPCNCFSELKLLTLFLPLSPECFLSNLWRESPLPQSLFQFSSLVHQKLLHSSFLAATRARSWAWTFLHYLLCELRQSSEVVYRNSFIITLGTQMYSIKFPTSDFGITIDQMSHNTSDVPKCLTQYEMCIRLDL